MRKTILSIIFLLILLLVPTMVFAAEGDVAKVGEETFTVLDEAIEAAKNNGEDVVILKTIEVNEDVTINIDGVNITGSVQPLFTISGGAVNVVGNGTITGDKVIFNLKGNFTPGGDAIKAEVTIGSDVKLISKGMSCIYIRGNGARTVVNGYLEAQGEYAGIQGNGSVSSTSDSGNTEIIVNSNAVVKSTGTGHGIYHPQFGKLTINGGEISGVTGIEMRAGELVVENGTITGTAVPVEVNSNGSGSTSTGAGIAIAQHNTKLDTSVIVKGGTIQGYSALYQSNPEKNDAESVAKISVAIDGGKFETINGGKVAVYSENKTGFITGGNFSTTVGNLKAEGYVEKQNAKGSFDVYKEYTTVVDKNNSIGVVQTETVKETLNASLQLNTDLNKKVQEATEKGQDVTIEIKVEELDKDVVAEEEKQKILQTVKENQKVHQYFDISVLVVANQNELGKITQLTEKMKFSIKISEDLIQEGRKFYILKLHGDKVERIETVLNGTSLEFETDQFSTFALAYEDGVEATDEKDDTPKTGSINVITYVWMTLVVMAVFGLITTKKPSKHSK